VYALEFTSSQFDLHGGDMDWPGVEQWWLKLLHFGDPDEDGEEPSTVGYVDAILVDCLTCDDPWDAMDARSGDLMTIGSALFDRSVGGLVGELGESVLIIDRAQIDQNHRGSGRGLLMVGAMIEKLGTRCDVIACWPAPAEGERTKVGVRKLQDHWKRLGFRALKSDKPDTLGRRTYILNPRGEFFETLASLRGSLTKV
jgi:hypothetical protein